MATASSIYRRILAVQRLVNFQASDLGIPAEVYITTLNGRFELRVVRIPYSTGRFNLETTRPVVEFLGVALAARGLEYYPRNQMSFSVTGLQA